MRWNWKIDWLTSDSEVGLSILFRPNKTLSEVGEIVVLIVWGKMDDLLEKKLTLFTDIEKIDNRNLNLLVMFIE